MELVDLNKKSWENFEPIAVDRIIDGNPAARVKALGKHDSTEFGLWEVKPGRFTLHKKGTEIVHILSGSGWLVSHNGSKIKLEPEVSFIIPDGFQGEWVIEETVKKFFMQL